MPAAADRDRARRAREEQEATAAAAGQRRRRLRLLGGALGAVVLVVAVVLALGAFKDDPAEGGTTTEVGGVRLRGASETAALLRGLPQDGVTLGRKDAPATILEIADLKCPACQAHELQTQPEVIDRLVRTGRANLQLQLINFRDAPAGTTDGEAARRAAYGLAAVDRFWDFAHLTFWNQGSEQDAWASESLLRAIAAAVPGLDAGVLTTRETPAVREAIAKAQGIARALRTDATPSVYVLARGARTGTRVGDASSVDAIERAVDEATRTAGRRR